MLIGIIANITKENVFEVVLSFISKLKKNKLDYILTKSLSEDKDKLKIELFDDFITDDKEVYEKADLIISIGGDGTMLATALMHSFMTSLCSVLIWVSWDFLLRQTLIRWIRLLMNLKKASTALKKEWLLAAKH